MVKQIKQQKKKKKKNPNSKPAVQNVSITFSLS